MEVRRGLPIVEEVRLTPGPACAPDRERHLLAAPKVGTGPACPARHRTGGTLRNTICSLAAGDHACSPTAPTVREDDTGTDQRLQTADWLMPRRHPRRQYPATQGWANKEMNSPVAARNHR